MPSRRKFLGASVGSAIALPLAVSTCNASSFQGIAPEWRNRNEQMRYRQLGKTGFMVSEVVMGGNEITPDNYEHILAALDAGLNYLDTSPAYGNGKSELGYAEVLKRRNRDSFFLTSKVSLWDVNRNEVYQKIFESLPPVQQTALKEKAKVEIEGRRANDPNHLVNYFGGQRGEMEAAALCNVMEKEFGHQVDRKKNYQQTVIDSVDQSLSRLGTDHLDILMCPHGASSPHELLNYPEVFEAFERLRDAGKVRFLGVSAHTDPAGVLRAAASEQIYSVAMVAYNIINEAFVGPAINEAEQKGVGVIAMKVARPIYPGINRGPVDPERARLLEAKIDGKWSLPQKAYLWALANKKLSAVIANMVDDEQVAQNLPLPKIAAGLLQQ